MFTRQNEQAINDAARPEDIRRSNREELARLIKQTSSQGHSARHTMVDQGEIAAMEGLERLLMFLDSMQSTSGRSRHLRDFAKLNEGTRASKDAKTLAANADNGAEL